MTDSLIDDVKALLDKDFGDDRILKQIFRACENDEVISNYERNYVRKLAEKYLGRRPETDQTKTSIDEKPIVPDIIMPTTPPLTKTQSYGFTSQTSSSNSKNSKIMLGIGSVVLGIIILIAISINGIPSTTVNPSDDIISVTLSIQTDLSSYSKNDIVSISGMSDTSDNVNLSIENSSNVLVWTEQIPLRPDGTYSTLSIAGGLGWETSGTYTIKVDNGVEIKSSTFYFTT
ncbi:MAG: hypothetical protein ACRBB5_01660 [Nitrosopumilus sp.]